MAKVFANVLSALQSFVAFIATRKNLFTTLSGLLDSSTVANRQVFNKATAAFSRVALFLTSVLPAVFEFSTNQVASNRVYRVPAKHLDAFFATTARLLNCRSTRRTSSRVAKLWAKVLAVFCPFSTANFSARVRRQHRLLLGFFDFPAKTSVLRSVVVGRVAGWTEPTQATSVLPFVHTGKVLGNPALLAAPDSASPSYFV
mmetsp:Transcript_1543/g.2488  ORF Transcript_1543/g.2488 Transcript_1543/m.2488 type:complete len:201 (-) Transcript_1543:207-809(-)